MRALGLCYLYHIIQKSGRSGVGTLDTGIEKVALNRIAWTEPLHALILCQRLNTFCESDAHAERFEQVSMDSAGLHRNQQNSLRNQLV